MGLRLRLVVAQALVGACCVGASAELGPPAGAGSAPEADAARSARAQPSVSPRFERFTLRSPRLSAFSGEEVSFEAVFSPRGVDLFDPHPELYPEGLLGRIEGEMWAAFMAFGAAPKRR